MAKRKILVERDDQLRTLEEVVTESTIVGGVVLLSGEAGFGKTSLIDALVDRLDHRYRVLRAACEPLDVPAAFAPLFDVADRLPEELSADIRLSARQAVMAGMLDLLKNDRIVLILEDVHWSDESTLGLIRYLGRRIEATNSVVIVSFRLEEVDLAHPLRLVIADLGREATRIALPALTPNGVKLMAAGVAIDPVKVHGVTLGNPFFVEEVIRNPESKVPPTVENVVLANAARLSPQGRDLLYLIALSPEGVAMDHLLKDDPALGRHIDLATQRGLLSVGDRGLVTCRHELIRDSLLQAAPPALQAQLHRRLLTLLEGTTADRATTARLAYHSMGAGIADKALAYSLEAARNAATAGAHRHAAFHYSNALDFRMGLETEVLKQTLLAAAFEHYLVNSFDAAIDFSRQRMALASSPLEVAQARAWVAFFEGRKNHIALARQEATEALGILELEEETEELALALSVIAMVDRMAVVDRSTIDYANRAVAIARSTGSVWIEVQAATSAGATRLQFGDRSGLEQLEAAVELGIEAGVVDAVARAMYAIAISHYYSFRLDEALHWFRRALDYTSAGEVDMWYVAILVTVANIEVATGRWAEADHDLEKVLGHRTCVSTEFEALATAATLRARRGDPGSMEMVSSLLARLDEDSGLEERLMATALAMEAAWMGLLSEATAFEYYRELCASGALANEDWDRGWFAFRARRLGLEPPEGHIFRPIRLELEGHPEEAATVWEERGYPIEATITRACAPGADLEGAFSNLKRLGAEGVASGLRRELGRRGVKGIPRGVRSSTKSHPAGLTSRQAEVLDLMVAGHSNAAIAEELYISEKTTGHHVSAILSKLGATNRSQAVAMALARGWTDLGS